MKTRKYFILAVVVFVLVAGLLVQANSKRGPVTPDETQSLEETLVKTCSKEISTIGKITDRNAFLQGVFFAHRVVERIRSEGGILSLRAIRERKEILSGVEGVCVVVENLPTSAEKYGLTQQLLQTDSELRLRTHGIKVGTAVEAQDIKFDEQTAVDSIVRLWECGNEAKSNEDFLRSARGWVNRGYFETYRLSGQLPTLYVNVNAIVHEERNLAAFAISTELTEGAYLCRNSALVAHARVWKRGAVGTCSTSDLKDYVREWVRDFVDEFVNDYLAANPKDQSVEEIQ